MLELLADESAGCSCPKVIARQAMSCCDSQPLAFALAMSFLEQICPVVRVHLAFPHIVPRLAPGVVPSSFACLVEDFWAMASGILAYGSTGHCLCEAEKQPKNIAGRCIAFPIADLSVTSSFATPHSNVQTETFLRCQGSKEPLWKMAYQMHLR